MEVPATIKGEKPKITVILANNSPRQKKYFHCSICGHKVFAYWDDQRIIIAGSDLESFAKAPLEIQCSGAITIEKDGHPITTTCKALYYVTLST